MRLHALLALLLLPAMVFAKEPEAKEDGYATIHLYRKKSTLAMLWKYKIAVNGKKVKVQNNRYYEVKVKPGDVRLRALSAKHSTVELKAEPGKDYYVKTYIRAGMFWNYVEMAEVTPQFADKDAMTPKEKKIKTMTL